MPRIRQAARRCGSGPPCHLDVRTDLTNEFYHRCRDENIDLDLQDEESIAFRRKEFAMIDLKVEASVIANDGREYMFGRRLMAVLPKIHHEVETKYHRALKKGVDHEEAKTLALEHVSHVLELILRSYDREQEVAAIPENAQRTQRLQQRKELNEASDHLQIPGGPSAADNEELLALLATMEAFRDHIVSILSRPDLEGRIVHLLVTKDMEHRKLSYEIFSCPVEVGAFDDNDYHRFYKRRITHGSGFMGGYQPPVL